jgi:hypothetical protein
MDHLSLPFFVPFLFDITGRSVDCQTLARISTGYLQTGSLADIYSMVKCRTFVSLYPLTFRDSELSAPVIVNILGYSQKTFICLYCMQRHATICLLVTTVCFYLRTEAELQYRFVLCRKEGRGELHRIVI